jgi:gamma-glutamyltranspeptidase/glutathione hydrolase
MALGMLQHFDLGSLKVDTAATQHLMIEAMKLAFADIDRHVAEPAAMACAPEQLLDPAYLAARARSIDPTRAQDFGPGALPRGGTVYLSTADASGMMVSFIQSNYMGFGSGVVLPNWGVSLQNRGHAFSLDAAHANVVAPGKRPFHTIIPAFLMQDERPRMAFGVMGAHMQPQGHVQTLARMLDWGQNPQTACDAPRWLVNHDGSLSLEASMDKAVAQGLASLGHRVTTIRDSYQDFGAGQFIWCLGATPVDGYVAASDARRDGQAVGF